MLDRPRGVVAGDLEVSGSPMDLPIGPYRGGRSVYLEDPDGVNIQLMQLAGRPGRMPVLRRGDPPEAALVRSPGTDA